VDLGRFEEGFEHLHQALDLAEQHDDLATRAWVHWGLAWAWQLRGDDRQALRHATRTLDLYRALALPVWEAEALNAVGWYAARLGEYDMARTHCRAALALHRRHDHPEGEAATLDSLGYIEHHTGDHEQAIEHYRQAVVLLRALGNNYQAANTLDDLGRPYVALICRSFCQEGRTKRRPGLRFPGAAVWKGAGRCPGWRACRFSTRGPD
jgi:tetratricopeptide (TPR) repeat protein